MIYWWGLQQFGKSMGENELWRDLPLIWFKLYRRGGQRLYTTNSQCTKKLLLQKILLKRVTHFSMGKKEKKRKEIIRNGLLAGKVGANLNLKRG